MAEEGNVVVVKSPGSGFNRFEFSLDSPIIGCVKLGKSLSFLKRQYFFLEMEITIVLIHFI